MITHLFLCLCLPILDGRGFLYDGLLKAYHAFKEEGVVLPPNGRRYLGSPQEQTSAEQDEIVRNMLKWPNQNASLDSNEVEWSIPFEVTTERQKKPVCGVVKPFTLSRIVGGVDAKEGSWPWIAALGYEVEGGIKFLCGGTLITDRHVLTAAHCIANQLSPTTVLLGATELRDMEGPNTGLYPIAPRGRHVHERYNASTHENDIAVLTLDFPITFSDAVRAACLPLHVQLSSNDYHSHDAWVAGWGATIYREGTSKLQQLQLPILSEEVCRRAYEKNFGQVIDSRNICAGFLNGTKDACQGDSGGPLIWQYEGSYFVIGIVSYGYKCAQASYPGVYTRVASFIDWILKTIMSE